jgi:hypothetical protein
MTDRFVCPANQPPQSCHAGYSNPGYTVCRITGPGRVTCLLTTKERK